MLTLNQNSYESINSMTQNLTVKIFLHPHAQDLPLPTHATLESAGVDLMAAISQDIIIEPFARALIPAGVSVYLPRGYEAQIRPRSGLALKHGITVLNSPGTIDSDYTGQVQVILINLGQEPFTVTRGMRIAQMLIAQHSTITWDIQNQPLDAKTRMGGFGSTGV